MNNQELIAWGESSIRSCSEVLDAFKGNLPDTRSIYWEADFARSILKLAKAGKQPSPKQQAVINRMIANVGRYKASKERAA